MTDEHTLTHLHDLFYCDDGLGFCGCGDPYAAVDLVGALLSLVPFVDGDNWAATCRLIGTPGAVHIVVGALDRAGLIEHGSSIRGSWLTPKGLWARDALRRCQDSEALIEEISERGGVPHWPDPCTDACWVLPAGEEQR